MIKVLVKKLIETAILPTHGSDFAAGYDLYTSDDHELLPGTRHLYKTGLAIAMPPNVYGRIAPRSGLAYKNGIDVMAGVIDCFSESSSIKSPNGDKLVRDLKIDDVVYSINENLEVEEDFVSAIVALGDAEILIIETDDGILEVTGGTLVYTTDGIKLASELKEMDKILHF